MIAVSLIVLAGLAAAGVLRKRSAATRHWVLATALACAAVAPALELIVPAWDFRTETAPPTPQVRPQIVTSIVGEVPAEAGVGQPTKPHHIFDRAGTLMTRATLMAIWIAGTGISFFVLFVGLARLAWLASRSRPVRTGRWAELAQDIACQFDVRRPILLLQSDHPTLLVTWGLVRPKVMLPAGASEWGEDRMRIVLCHEVAHVRRGDWGTQMLSELLRAVYWFNPFVWMAGRRLRQESELACDDAVLNQGIEGPRYAQHLLDLARAIRRHRRVALPDLPAPAMVRPSTLERRVTAMLNTRLNRKPMTPFARIVATMCLATAAVLIVGLVASAQSSATFSGSVVDPMTSAVPKVAITLTSVQREAKHEVLSDQNGQFEFVALPAGDYLLEARYPGFEPLKETVTLAGRNIERTLALKIGSLRETVTVVVPTSAREAPTVPGVDERPARRLDDCNAASSGGNVRPPRKLTHESPTYPAQLAGTASKETVVLDARIGLDGAIREITAVEPANPDLANAAVDAVRRWKFEPTLLNCVPIEVMMRVTVNFEAR
jgi:beta-lactamase regulating signal transducer with metallopeptidase domain